MQIPSFSASAQIILSGSSQNIDGSRKEPNSVAGVQSPDDGTQVTGSSGSSAAVQPAAQSLDQVTAPKQEAAIQTKVVTAADETLGTSLGLNIDTTA
tara:strand:- start:3628 stop:3918 length:291 start_codon:yes stop_codon:yes gene_type:complete